METNKNTSDPQRKYIALQEPLNNLESNPNSITISIQNPDIINQQENNSSSNFLIFIKFMDNTQKEIDISNIMDKKISELQKLAFPDSFNDVTKSIRLIFQGRLLNADDLINQSNLQKNGFIHGIVSEKIEQPPSQGINNIQPPSQPPITDVNYEAINMLNILLEAHSINNVRPNPQNPQINNNSVQRLELANSNEDSCSYFIMGVVLGYCLSLWAIMLLCVFNFPEKAKNGIIMGFCLHVFVKTMSNIMA